MGCLQNRILHGNKSDHTAKVHNSWMNVTNITLSGRGQKQTNKYKYKYICFHLYNVSK